MQYRKEIDGLRAIAVLPVILYHAGFTSFSGGFVGVDVFFVISGYLITSILFDEIRDGRFSIGRFYERRARRILPALFVVMLASVPFAYMWMLPTQLSDFAASLVTTALALSNLYFLSQIDYFAPDADLQPLLHTWSLAIEEQYYFFFPLVLLTIRNQRRKVLIVCLACMTLFSFAFAEWGWRTDPARNFFFTLSRFWEIGVGSLCAVLMAGKLRRSSDFLAGSGLTMILLSILTFDSGMPFPSAYTIVPVGGAALIILFAGERTWTTRLLSLPVLVGIGLLSYSAYLWHQPLFAFVRLRSFTEPDQYVMGASAAAALALGWVTWRFVEQPFRQRVAPVLPSRRMVFASSGASIVVIVAIGLVGYLGDGLGWRLDDGLRRYDPANIVRAWEQGECALLETDVITYPIVSCQHEDSKGRVDVLIAGDSHAAAVSEEIGYKLNALDIGNYRASYLGCLALPDLRPFGPLSARDCKGFNDKLYEYADAERIQTLVLIGRYQWYLTGTGFDNKEGGSEPGEPVWYDLLDQVDSRVDDPARPARVLAAYEDRIRHLAKRFNIVLVYPIPEAGWDVPSTGFRRTFLAGDAGPLGTSYEVYKERTRAVTTLFDQLVDEFPNIHAARVYEAFCSDETGRCVNEDAKEVYYSDDDHLSSAGAKVASPVIVEAIMSALAKSD